MTLNKQQLFKPQPITKLGEVKPGQIVRFATDSVDEAFAEGLFWMRIESFKTEGDRVRLIDLASGKQVERDAIHHVVIHAAELNISPE